MSYQIRICIEGNIGAGKTMLIARILDFLQVTCGSPCDVVTILETIDQELLEKYNRDPVTFGYLFQLAMMNLRLDMLREAEKQRQIAITNNRNCVILIDTGPLRELAFTAANEKCGNINVTVAKQHIDRFCELLKTEPSLAPEHLVLITPSADQCMRNILKRSRGTEHLLSKSYINVINDTHVQQLLTLMAIIPQTSFHHFSVGDRFPGIYEILQNISPLNELLLEHQNEIVDDHPTTGANSNRTNIIVS